MASRNDELQAGVTRAVRALGFEPDVVAYDGTLQSRALEVALTEAPRVLARVGCRLARGSDDFGPEPIDGLWLCVEPSSRGCRMTPLFGGEVTTMDVVSVRLTASDEWCCEAANCERTRRRYAVDLEVRMAEGRGDFVVHEGTNGEDARNLAVALARALGVELRKLGVVDEVPTSVEETLPEPVMEAPWELSALELARWRLGCEAGRWVVRDRTSLGPRAALGVELALFGGALAAALGAGITAALGWQTGDRERAAIFGVCSVVAAITSYAFLGISLHSARYRSLDTPVLFAYRDRLVAAPWVSRSGAVRLVAAGSYGAGLPIAGITAIEHRKEGAAQLLVCVSDHGPIELARFDSERLALAWQRILRRMLEMSRHVVLVVLLVGGLLQASACCPRESSALRTLHPGVPPTEATGLPAASVEPRASVVPVTRAVMPSAPVVVEVPEPSVPALAMLDDDVPAALVKGRAGNVPVLVEVWAAWCHTCLSMRAFVLPEPAIRSLDKRVVFAAVDSENAANSAFLERYRIASWPTFLMLDPGDGSVLGLWEGSASVEELRGFILAAADARGAATEPALAALVEGARAQSAGHCEVATEQFVKALARGGLGWSRRSEAVKGLIYCQRRQRLWQACVATGVAELARLQGTSAPADVASTLLECAEALPVGPDRARATELAIQRLRTWVDSPPDGSSVDDHADALVNLASALRAAGDTATATALLARQLSLLEGAAAAAFSPQAAATFDYARMNAYLAAGKGEQAIAMLSERTRQLPDNYEPHARLGQVFAVLRRYPEADAAMAAALTRVRGPRRIRYLGMQADIAAALADGVRERAILTELVRTYEALPGSARANPNHTAAVAAARRRMQSLR